MNMQQPTLGSFPNLARAFSGLKISIELENICDDTTIGHEVKKLARHNKTTEAIKVVIDAAKDNRELVSECIGEELLQKIEEFVNTER
jgi:hypothetical protein